MDVRTESNEWRKIIRDSFGQTTVQSSGVPVSMGRYYDRVRFPSGFMPAHFGMFEIPMGNKDPFTGQIKDRNSTNMVKCCSLPMPNVLALQRIRFVLDSAILPADLKTILDYSWAFEIGGDHRILQGHLMADARIETLEKSLSEAQAEESIEAWLDECRPAPAKETFIVEIPFVIQAGMCFRMRFESDREHTLEQGADLLVMLEGFEAKQVEGD